MIIRKTFIYTVLILLASAVNAAELDKILEKDFIEFAVYESFPPWSYKDENGRIKGISIDIAKAIGNELGVQTGFKMMLADESMEDDLRNMVWKGHYLAGPPADVMLHAPYDINFAKANDKVIFTQPYFKEVVAFVINPNRIRSSRELEIFRKEKIGVETATLSDAYLLGAYGGQLRNNVMHYATVSKAIDAMMQSEISAVMANRGELEYSLAQYDNHEFLLTKFQTPGLSVEGWSLSAAISVQSPILASKVNEIIGKLKSNGKIEEIFIKNGLSFHPALDTQMLINIE